MHQTNWKCHQSEKEHSNHKIRALKIAFVMIFLVWVSLKAYLVQLLLNFIISKFAASYPIWLVPSYIALYLKPLDCSQPQFHHLLVVLTNFSWFKFQISITEFSRLKFIYPKKVLWIYSKTQQSPFIKIQIHYHTIPILKLYPFEVPQVYLPLPLCRIQVFSY